MKTIHVKPSLYAYYFLSLKEIAVKYGYNLVLHGSLATDMDLIAVPWAENVLPHGDMIDEFAEKLGGYIMDQNGERYKATHHGRIWYVININRGTSGGIHDLKYYLDISLFPPNR